MLYVPLELPRGGTHLTEVHGTHTHLAGVDGAGDAVRDLQVHLGDVVVRDRGGLAQVTDGGLLDHVAHDEALDCLVLRGLLCAVAATHGGGVSTALLVTSVVASLDGHLEGVVWETRAGMNEVVGVRGVRGVVGWVLVCGKQVAHLTKFQHGIFLSLILIMYLIDFVASTVHTTVLHCQS